MLVALEHHVRLRYLDEVVAFFRELVDRKEGLVRGRVELPARRGRSRSPPSRRRWRNFSAREWSWT